jgi:16S rRNA (adenine1518-N6/adenine1519-N6)-dimethyltransferase
MKLSKSLSQVFLKDINYIDKILHSLDTGGEEVLEIGPGTGEISSKLCAKTKFLYCVELDSRFISVLKEKFKNSTNVEIIHGDILEFKLSFLGKKLIIFGNIPYQISNSLVGYLVENRKYVKKAYLTLQKEFAEKLAAQVSTKAYGFLSCYVQYYAEVEKLFDIPARAFFPAPKVDSSFVRLEFYEKSPYAAANEDFLFQIIRRAFSQRRKKISNSLNLPGGSKYFLSSLNIEANKRAENLSLKEYMFIANKLSEG